MEKAVALKYQKDLPAPFILASGKGELAARLKSIAIENGIPIASEPPLAEALIDLKSGDFIPEEYYQIIAEILVFVRNIQEER